MSLRNIYKESLFNPCDPGKILELSEQVFKQGHLELLDDLIVSILPLANIVYYKYIRCLDDREYAKDDLISDSVLRLYQDMKLRWDKYIGVDAYYHYYTTVLKNGMIGLVHGYHNFYSVEDVDVEELNYNYTADDAYDDVDIKLLKESINNSIISTSEKILSCRFRNSKLLINILHMKYIDHGDLSVLGSRVRVLGITHTLFSFYCEHVDYVYKLAYNYQYALLGGKKKMIERISSILDRFEDVTYKMLSAKYYDTIIPEIYAEFGSEIANKFVKTFSNRTIRVPDYREFKDDLLGGVVLSLAKGDKSNLYEIAESYEMPYRSLARIYNKAVDYTRN